MKPQDVIAKTAEGRDAQRSESERSTRISLLKTIRLTVILSLAIASIVIGVLGRP
jgi:hypothetical protein